MPDVNLTITIPAAWVTKVLAAFHTIVDTHMTIEARGSGDPATEFDGRWDFRIAPKGAGENNLQFGQRVFRELGKAVVNMVDKAEDGVRYKTDIAAVPPSASNVPDDILT